MSPSDPATGYRTDPVSNPSPADTVVRELGYNEEIKIGRAGHYSFQTTCQEATVVFVNEDGLVTIRGHDHTGDPFSRIDVAVQGPIEGQATFHLTRQCPWGR
jgi:hypothetical protein